MKENTLRDARPGASQVLIVLTDGVSQDEVKQAASDLIGSKATLVATIYCAYQPIVNPRIFCAVQIPKSEILT